MAATETADSVYDHMTRLRMKMVQQVGVLYPWHNVETNIKWCGRIYKLLHGDN